MFQIIFYRDKNGKIPVLAYLEKLEGRKDKDSRIKLTKIRDYIRILQLHGTMAGEPYIKHLDGDIWELRPLRDRVLFAAWNNGRFVLLHQFMKTTQKTPRQEIEKAKREWNDFLSRSEDTE